MTGRPNTVLAVEAEDVIVGTERSPEGQPVPLEEVEAAYERLMREGEIEIRPSTVGYRSAFVGAALASLPNTESGSGPRQIRISQGRPGRRNPRWSNEELILALDLYRRRGLPGNSDPDVIELSGVLNALPMRRLAGIPETFRNANGVAMKLANFARLDPGYEGTGLTRGGQREEEVWNRFAGREDELHRMATQIRAGVRTGEALPPVPESPESPEVEAARQEAAFMSQPGSPPPRRQSAAERRAIELRAMALAEEHYRDQGWSVIDVSSRESFDLLCERDEEELHVEVKGTTSNRPQVVLTANEVTHARMHPRVAMVWVSGIVVEGAEEPPVATGGDITLIDPWNLDDGTLEALSYAYVLPERR
jgi:hypothetical protein